MCVFFYFVQLPPNTQIEKKLLEVILHSCEKRWYSSPGFITYLPCDVNASPDGLMSVAVVQARVSLQTTGVAAWLSPGISRVALIGHCGAAGSAHLHHRVHHERLMKGLFEPFACLINILFTEPSRDIYCSLHGKVERWKLLPRPTRTDVWLGEREDRLMQALSSMFVA